MPFGYLIICLVGTYFMYVRKINKTTNIIYLIKWLGLCFASHLCGRDDHKPSRYKQFE